MGELNNRMVDFDPDLNYYDNTINQNHSCSSFDSIDSFLHASNKPFDNNNKIMIFSQNIRSLNRNLDNFLTMFQSDSTPDVFVFTETWHDINCPVIIPGYIGYHTTRNGRSGGVSVFVKKQFSSCQIDEFSYANQAIEICTVKIFNNISKLYICGIYRPHSDTIDNFSLELESILNENQLSNNSCVYAGDFNANLMSDDGDVYRFVDMMRSHHFLQVITDVTHPGIIGHSNSSLIDHVWLNSLCNYSSGVIKTGITDHHTTFIDLPFISHKSNSKKIEIKFRDCSTSNQQLFEFNLQSFDWESIKSNDVNTYTNNFISTVNNIYQTSFPIKTKFVTEKYFSNPWYTADVKKLSEARKSFYGLLLENLVTNAEYSNFRNKVTSLIRKCKQLYFERCFSRNIGNIKATWKIIRNICNGYQNRTIKEVSHDGVTYTVPYDIAESFNNFFVNIAENLAQNMPLSNDCPYTVVRRNPLPPITLEPVTQEECAEIIRTLKQTKQNIDHISVKMFQKYHHSFLNCLCDLINFSLSAGIFPEVFKHAIVVPIFKKGDPCILSNYRPIALLSFISKIFERCIFMRLVGYVSDCNLFTPNQYGFTKGKSTQDAIIALTEKIYDCWNDGDGSYCINILIDFQKCFDTIDHIILCHKLEMYGITDTFLKLIVNYLTDRCQSVRIDGILSSRQPITVGVPQGSILGPLLFLFFINDLPNISNKFTSILFADDTTLNFKYANTTDANTVCNAELGKFFAWTLANRLSISYNKTFGIMHSYRSISPDSLNLSINNNSVQFFNEGLFLGVTLDNKLKYLSHITNICTKLSKAIGIIYKLRMLNVPKSVLKQVYYSIAYPYLNYNVTSYAGTYQTHLDRILLLQKRLIRIMNYAPFLAHTDNLFFNSKILKINDIYNLNLGLYMYQHRDSGLYDRTHTYATRNRANLVPVRARLRITENSVSTAGPNLWNNIPNDVRMAPSRDSFKIRYKKYLLSSYFNNVQE